MNKNNFSISLKCQSFVLDVSTSFELGSCLGIYGESGSGKSTLLRCLAGLEEGIKGNFNFSGKSLLQGDVEIVSAEERDVVLCFQESKLFSHLSIEKNLFFSEKRVKIKKENFPCTSEIIEVLKLSHLLHKLPQALSGGEKKRVALAQALIAQPSLLLLDEPLAFLDAETQGQVLTFFAQLLENKRITLFYVSHNMQELCRLCENLLILDKGKLVFGGAIQDALTHQSSPLIYEANPFVSLKAEVKAYDSDYGISLLSTENGQIFQMLTQHDVGEKVQIKIEANNVTLALLQKDELSAEQTISVLNQLVGVLESVLTENKQSLLLLVDCRGDKILSKVSRLSYERMALKMGTQIKVLVKAASIYEF